MASSRARTNISKSDSKCAQQHAQACSSRRRSARKIIMYVRTRGRRKKGKEKERERKEKGERKAEERERGTTGNSAVGALHSGIGGAGRKRAERRRGNVRDSNGRSRAYKHRMTDRDDFAGPSGPRGCPEEARTLARSGSTANAGPGRRPFRSRREIDAFVPGSGRSPSCQRMPPYWIRGNRQVRRGARKGTHGGVARVLSVGSTYPYCIHAARRRCPRSRRQKRP